jgi:hypothetical protein
MGVLALYKSSTAECSNKFKSRSTGNVIDAQRTAQNFFWQIIILFEVVFGNLYQKTAH